MKGRNGWVYLSIRLARTAIKDKEIDRADVSGLWGAIVIEIPCRKVFTDTENFPEICYIPFSRSAQLKKT